MKTFKLNKILYQNVMSVGSVPIVIQLDVCLKTLITGTNGAGKSTMIEAITFALFGRSFRDIKKGQLINSTVGKNMLVELWMEYNSHSYQIRRGQKPNIFEIFKDGVKLDESASAKDFQSSFEEMIGMNYNSFKQVVVLGTAGYTPFMELSPLNRRKMVEDLLEVSILAEMDKENKSAIKELNNDIQKTDTDIQFILSQIKTHEDYNERQKKLSGDNLFRLESMYEDCLTALDGLKAANKVLNEQLILQVLGVNPENDITSNKTKYISLSQQMSSKQKVLNLYHNGGSCPTCLQELQNQSLVGEIQTDISSMKIKHDEFVEIEKSLMEKRAEYEKIRSMILKIENEISKNRSIGAQEVEKAKKLQVLISEAKKEIVDNSDTINELKTQHETKIDIKSKLVGEKYRRSMMVDMLKDSGIKSTIIKKYMPLFNKQINNYLGVMEADYSFNLDGEFNETIKSRGRESFSYASFSQGEKARIDIALLFTWRDIAEKVSGIKINCLFLDEVFDGPVDSQAMKSINQILGGLKDANVFIISHRDHNPQDYGQHLQMKKVGRFTLLEE